MWSQELGMSPKYNTKWRIHMASMVDNAQETYLAFVVDMRVHSCFLLDHEIAPLPPSKNTYPNVDLSPLRSYEINESLYANKLKPLLW